MTSLATLIGLIPMAPKLGTGSEAYAPLARAIIGGLAVSVVLTMFIVPAAYLLVYRRREGAAGTPVPARGERSRGMSKSIPILAIAGLLVLGVHPATAEEAVPLSLKEAEQIAIQKHPRITAAELNALASEQEVRQTRSAYFPTVTANATAVGASGDNTRIAAGALNNPLILDRNAEGINVSQIITDFGRTANLTASSKLHSRAAAQDALATRAEILLQLDAAFFIALQAQSVLEVAKQTVTNRQLIFDQVNELAAAQQKSGLDVSFAKVDLEESRLLLAGASNDLAAAFAGLNNLLGEREPRSYRLAEEPVPADEALVHDPAQLTEEALKNRPDLAQLRFERTPRRNLPARRRICIIQPSAPWAPPG